MRGGGNVTNGGTISSSNGIALYGFGAGTETIENNGIIYGQTVGVLLDGYKLINSGTITSPNTSIAMYFLNTLINTSSGVINGSIGPGNNNYTHRTTIQNAGTINGNVNLGSYANSQNTYIALTGGILNGNLILGGGGDTLVTNFINTGSGQFSGITGTVSGGGTDTLRYFVTSDVSAAALNVPSLFGNLIFDFANNANLSLTAATDSRFKTISFAGTGSASIVSNITGDGTNPILKLTTASLQTVGSSTTIVPTSIDLTSNGTLTQTHNSYVLYAPAVLLSATSKFTNNGVINASDIMPVPGYPVAAIEGSGTVVNNGTINLYNADGVIADSGLMSVVNNGTISRSLGDATSRGIVDALSVINTGTISTGGVAVTFERGTNSAMQSNTSPATLINSGTITSANAQGVKVIPSYLYSTSIVNQAGGSISGATYGISLVTSGITITNAGSITGGIYSIYADPIYTSSAVTLVLQTGSKLGGNVMVAPIYANNLILQGSGTEDSTFFNFTSLDMQGPGTWTLSGTNSIASTTVSGGTLAVTGALTSNYTINNGATLQGNTTTLLTSSPVSDNGVLVFNQENDGILSVRIFGTGSLIKEGVGTLQLAASNVFDGGTTINAGALLTSTDSALGTTHGGLTLNGGALIFGSQFNLANTRIVSIGTGGGTLNTNSFNTVLSQGISGSGALTKAGAGTLTLSGASTYTGSTTIGAGTLALIGSGSIASSSGVINNATFNIAEINSGATIKTLSGTGSVVLGSKSLTISNGSSEFSGTISGTGSLSVNGGSVVLSGTNTYSGGTTIATGATLQLGNGGTTGSIAGDVIDNGVLVFDRSDTYIFAGNISGSGAISLAGTGQVIFTGQNNLSGGVGVGGGYTLNMSDLGASGGSTVQSITNNGTVNFNNTGTQTFSGSISGSGAVTYTGGGTLIIGGDNTYTGPTTVTAGTLQIGSGGTRGSVGGAIINNGAVVFNVTGIPIISNVISGSGSLTLTGGTLTTLGGLNTYTGNTYVNTGMVSISSNANLGNGGTLVLAPNTGIMLTASGIYTHAVTVAGDPTFDVASGVVATWSGQISDAGISGDVEVIGGGKLILTNTANSYSGGTVVKGGSTLAIASDHAIGSTAGALTLGDATSSGTLQFTAASTLDAARSVILAAGGGIIDTNGFDATAAHAITGTGSLTKTGTGTLTITAANTYSGGTTISGGTLQIGAGGSVAGNITNNATLAFNRSDNITFAATVSGSGALTKNNNNTLTLNGVNTYSGATTVVAGRLVVGDATHSSASIASQTGGVTIASGASLSGFGKVTGTVVNNGTIITGLTAGSLTVGGLTQNAGGTLAVELSSTASSQLNVTGAATLGGTLNATFLSGAETPHVYSILTAGSITGSFASLSVSNGAADMAYGIHYATSGHGVDVVAMPQNAGQVYGDLRIAAFDTAYKLNTIAVDHIGSTEIGAGKWSTWARGVYGSAHTDGVDTASAFNTTSTGLVGGADYGFADGISAHAVFAYDNSDLKISSSATKASTSSVYIAFGGHAPISSVLLDVTGFYLSSSTDLSRDTALIGTATAKPDSSVFGATVQAGLPLLSGDLVPTVRISYAGFNQSATTETGADPLNLTLSSITTSQIRSDIGLRYAHRFMSGDVSLVPSFKLFLDETLSGTPNRESMALAGTAIAFSSPSAEAERTAVLFGAGLKTDIGNGLAIDFDLNSRIGSRQTEIHGTAGLSWRF